MTPEEKQAIIDKALELGFKMIDIFLFCDLYIYEVGNINIGFSDPEFIFRHIVNKEAIKEEKITSPSDLETLFKAIVS